MLNFSLFKKIFKILPVVLLVFAFSLVFINCDDDDPTSSEAIGFVLGGLVYDITNGNVLTGSQYTIKLDTGAATYTATVTTEGKYTFTGIPYNADYVVTVTATGYVDFQSSTDMITTSYAAAQDKYMIAYRTIPLIPTTVVTPAITVTVVDNYSSANISAGHYKLVRAGIEGTWGDDLWDTNYGSYNELGTGTGQDIEQMLQDAKIVGGTFTGGSFTIAAGALLYGYDYTLIIYNVSGYEVYTTGIAPYEYHSNYEYLAELEPLNDYNTLRVIAQSNIDIDDNWLLLPAGRTLTFYFNQDIELDPMWQYDPANHDTYLDGNAFIDVVTYDSDGDGVVNANQNEGNTGATTWLTTSVSNNTLTITLAADATLLNDTSDAGDELAYDIDLRYFRVRPALPEGNENWYELDNVTGCKLTTAPETRVVIRNATNI